MPLPRPKSLLMLGRRVSIKAINLIEGDEGLMGLHEYSEARITLKGTMPGDMIKAVAVHEMFHDIEDLVKAKISERDVHAMSSVLFAVIRDNPEFFAWLQEK